ncbi:NF-kappa-B inhibitor-like protein 1 [Haliotis rufescens]|uniref:NF-kappa-B inhibitor-like protein 1 n=1 Tax=Haliotis rufescens TaxID=6454 RepID=UPI001EAF9039|nr:NF-kappa-B inhibitor-like protein 1 [Haliotis rufescens]
MDMLDKNKVKKLKKYIKDDRPCKLKSYVKKYRIYLKDVELTKGRSLLHYCCQHGSGGVLRYLLTEGVSAVEPDNGGDLPLHVSLKQALDLDSQQSREAYTEMVLPLLETVPETLEVRNHSGMTCRQLLDQLVNRNRQEEEAHARTVSEEWEKKLGEELNWEEEEFTGRYHTEYDYYEEHTQDSYDQWADQIHSNYRWKHRQKTSTGRDAPPSHTKARHKQKAAESKKPRVLDEEKLRQIREELKRKYEANQKCDVENRKKRRKNLYEKNFEGILSKDNEDQLSFKDIPWPGRGSLHDFTEVLFCDFPDKSSSKFRKYLRDQQIRWHPDKFTQKFGKRLLDSDRDKIMEKVKEISQALNKVAETLPKQVT